MFFSFFIIIIIAQYKYFLKFLFNFFIPLFSLNEIIYYQKKKRSRFFYYNLQLSQYLKL